MHVFGKLCHVFLLHIFPLTIRMGSGKFVRKVFQSMLIYYTVSVYHSEMSVIQLEINIILSEIRRHAFLVHEDKQKLLNNLLCVKVGC